jgi:hypothetical protein
MATVYEIVPVDVADELEVMVIHETLLDAVHEQPEPVVVTVAENAPPSSGTDCEVGDSV